MSLVCSDCLEPLDEKSIKYENGVLKSYPAYCEKCLWKHRAKYKVDESAEKKERMKIIEKNFNKWLNEKMAELDKELIEHKKYVEFITKEVGKE